MSVNSLPWYHVPSPGLVGDTIRLSGDEWHHCHQVLRMREGDHVILFDGQGWCSEAAIRESERTIGILSIIQDCTAYFTHERLYRVSVAFAPTKQIDRTEMAVEKLVELGVDEIIFLDCAHAERSHLRIDRMEKIVLSAAKQSRKIRLPVLHDMITPNLLITHYRKEKPGTQILCCHMHTEALPLVEKYIPGGDVLLMTGPEGGFSNEETEQMISRGASMVLLGPYRLRVETAVIAGCHAVHIMNELKQTL